MGNVIPHKYEITSAKRALLKKQKPLVVWFSGLSGSGKSTLANWLEKKLFAEGFHTYILDGDNIRLGLNKDLGFDQDSRNENIRRIAEVCKLFLDSGLIVIAAFITPKEKDRRIIESILGNHYLEVFVDTPLEVCEKRDVKGLYKKARNGEISNFTGISCDFEIPLNPDLHIKTESEEAEESIGRIFQYIHGRINEN
ncbi:adenylylsulfate kinase [Zunongwangia mangrovi]|uniref:Adenylyl-sulfate kinase n=1 Tax=Zunongwangia mangrovi TaxID=1334022 RepID=A0A1I1D6U5_9FLAO|nr:adenylyl-sulfate kinase [Zunongwangia mangrovi]SFB70092.1 adenylylsulfate kinase [Zunongwangia mangrovi]|tara:strand:- start:1054 stop:1644 length:591 start_codon:yes stop_codon:yes gene_type:complete